MSVFFLLHKVTVPYLIKDPHYIQMYCNMLRLLASDKGPLNGFIWE